MAPITAPKCQQEGCNNPTWYGLCHHHQSGAPSGVPASNGTSIGSPASPSVNFIHYANVSDLWSDLLGAFPDAGDVVQPKTIRQEALDTLSSAVDNEAYRRFPSLDVADYNEREELVAQMREKMVDDLLPEVSHVTGSEARELSYSSADQYGRSAEDSRYLASYALNVEWECHRIMGGADNVSYEQFVKNAVPDMRDAIDMAFRRNLGEFNEIIRQVSHREPLNSQPIAPHLAVEPIIHTRPEDDLVQGQVIHDPVDSEIADWFVQNRKYLDATGPEVPAQPNHQPVVQYEQRMTEQERPESLFGQLLRKGVEKAKDYIEDPDGIHEANRIKARDERERAARQRQIEEDERIERELKRELLIQRKNRNRKSRGWF